MTLLAAFVIPGFEIYDFDYLQTRKMWKPQITSKTLIYSNLNLISVFLYLWVVIYQDHKPSEWPGKPILGYFSLEFFLPESIWIWSEFWNPVVNPILPTAIKKDGLSWICRINFSMKGRSAQNLWRYPNKANRLRTTASMMSIAEKFEPRILGSISSTCFFQAFTCAKDMTLNFYLTNNTMPNITSIHN